MILAALLVALPTAACDAALERAVAARLDSAEGPWVLQCIDADTLQITRGPYARVVPLAGLSPGLRSEVAVLAARALLRLKGEPEAGAPAVAELRDEPPAPVVRSPLRVASAEVVVIPRTEPGPALRGGFWQATTNGLRPLVHGEARWFPLEGTWLAGGAVGFDWRALQVFARVSGSAVQRVRALVAEAAGSLALACVGAPIVAGCLRVEASVGAASVALVDPSSLTAKSGWSVFAEGALGFEFVAQLPLAWLGLTAQVGAAVGPKATVAGAAGPGWAGLVLGVNLEVGLR